MGLCWLGALRGLWGFCARVELGGYMTCGVFAPIFPLFSLLLYVCLSFSLVCPMVVLSLLSCLSCLVCCCGLVVFVVSFSLSVYTQKERARRVGASSLVLLWVC